MFNSSGIVLAEKPSIGIEPTRLYDASRFKNHGTHTNITMVRTPKGLWVRRYDGSSFINIDAVVGDLAATKTGTWMVWLKLDDATPTTTCNPISITDASALEGILFQVTTTGLLRAAGYDAGAEKWDLQTDAAIISDGKYTNLAMVHNGTTPVLLVNGVQVDQAFTAEADKTAWCSVMGGLDTGRIGCFKWTGGANSNFITNGETALIKLLNYALSAGQIKKIFEKQRPWFGV